MLSEITISCLGNLCHRIDNVNDNSDPRLYPAARVILKVQCAHANMRTHISLQSYEKNRHLQIPVQECCKYLHFSSETPKNALENDKK